MFEKNEKAAERGVAEAEATIVVGADLAGLHAEQGTEIVSDGALKRTDSEARCCEGAIPSGTSVRAEAARDAAAGALIKVRLPIKALVFILTVISLSWFFEGLRQIQQSFSLAPIALLLIGILTTVLFVGVQSYWIYLEEKSKGTLKRRIEFFEKLYEQSQKHCETSERGKS